MILTSLPHASYAPHLRVLPHAARARDGGGARAGGGVSSQRDARVIEQPPGGVITSYLVYAARGHAGGGMDAWVHGCMGACTWSWAISTCLGWSLTLPYDTT